MTPLDHLPERRLTFAEERVLAKEIQVGVRAGKQLSELSVPNLEVAKMLTAKIKFGEDARQLLVMHTMREALAYSRKIASSDLPDGQLGSICYDVLNRGAVRFNPKFGRFFAFCKPGVRGGVRNYFRNQSVVKIKDKNHPVAEPRPWKNDPKRAEEGLEAWDDSDLIAPEHEVSEPDFKSIDIRERWELVQKIMKKVCTPKERKVLELSFIAGHDFQELANMLFVTRSAIQALCAKGLHKIKKELARRKLLND